MLKTRAAVRRCNHALQENAGKKGVRISPSFLTLPGSKVVACATISRGQGWG
jgi:hypothetical protein